MAGTKNAGDAADKVLAVIEAGMAAELDTVEALYTDGVVLVDPPLYVRAPQARYEDTPAIVCVPEVSEPQHDQGSHNIRIHEVFVEIIVIQTAVTVSGITPAEYLSKHLERQLLAVENILTANSKLTVSAVNNADALYITEAAYSSIGEDGGRMEKRARLEVRVYVST